MSQIVLTGGKIFVVPEVLITGVPTQPLRYANGDTRLRRLKRQRKSLRRAEGGKIGTGDDLCGNVAAVARVLDAIVTHIEIKAPHAKTRAERADMQITQIVRDLIRKENVVGKEIDSAKRFQVKLGVTGIEGKPFHRRP